MLRGTPYDLNTPYSQQYSFDVQRQIGRGVVLDTGYYGQKGTHLLGIRDINQVPVGLAYSSGVIAPNTYVTSATTPRLNALRPYRGYNAVNVLETNYNENYNSLQVNALKRFTGNTQVNLAYTWSKGMGDTQSDRSNAPQNSYNVAAERGRLAIDRTHVATANFVFEIPYFRSQKGFAGKVLGGWEVSGIATFQSGLPLNVSSALGNDPAGLGIIGASAAGPRPGLQSERKRCSAPQGFAVVWNFLLCGGPIRPDSTRQCRPRNNSRTWIAALGHLPDQELQIPGN